MKDEQCLPIKKKKGKEQQYAKKFSIQAIIKKLNTKRMVFENF